MNYSNINNYYVKLSGICTEYKNGPKISYDSNDIADPEFKLLSERIA
jgi:hypothetical protein